MTDAELADKLDALADDSAMVAAFRRGWHHADERGDYGNRVPSGLRALAAKLREDHVAQEEPTEPGWYAYSGGRQTIIFHLRETGQWSAHFDNGTANDCSWAYIGQALDVWDLVRFDPAAVKA